MTIPSQIKNVQTRGKKVASTTITTTTITTTSTTTVVNTNVQTQVQLVKSRNFFTLPKYISQENQRGSEQRKRKQTEAEKQKSRYLFIRLVSF